jgi:hypothetical protein
MNVLLCPRCWCPHTMASPCGVSAVRYRGTWGIDSPQQQIVDRAEQISVDRYLRARRIP